MCGHDLGTYFKVSGHSVLDRFGDHPVLDSEGDLKGSALD